MTRAERIKYLRKELGMTAEELGERIGKTRATIYRYENGEIEDMPITVLEPLAKALGTTPAYLMGWEENLENSGGFVANMMMDVEFTNYAKKMFSLSPEDRSKVYGYIDALCLDGK